MIYLINGDTFTGKTTYLRKYMKEHPQKRSLYMTNEEWTEMLIACSEDTDCDDQCIELLASKLSNCDILCIDNIDFLGGKPATQIMSAKTILKLNQDRDIFLAGIDLHKRISTMIEEFSNSNVDVSFIDFTV